MPSTPDAEKTARIESDARFTPRYASPEPQFAPGSIIAGRYRIAGILGKGGMGEVYRADDTKLGQPVALKFLPARLARDPILLARLHDEVRHGRQVSHPNVCRIYDIAEWNGAHFVAMEFVDGEDLARLLHRIGRLAHDKAVDIARGIAAGLLAAHAKGILHRDLKPANVMVDSHGDARITDFGLALSATDDQDGDISGTPAYMAPEQLEGAPATVQSDLYALGLVMYELFTGHRAHAAKTFPDRLRELTSEITIPSNHIRDLDPAVERIILRCLARDPAQRPRSARDVIESLPGGDPLAAALAAGETPSPRIVAAAGSEGSLTPRGAWSLLAAVALLMTLLVVARRDAAITKYVTVDESPEVLQHRAKEMLQRYGIATTGKPVVRLSENLQVTGALRAKKTSAAWETMRNGPPPVLMHIVYGLSPREVSVAAPLTTAPGHATIDLDLRGRLHFLLAAPSATTKPRPLDWKPLLADAGFEPAQLRAATPTSEVPPVAFDTLAAWSGTWPGDATPVRIDAAAWRGTPVWLRVTGPWSAGSTEGPFRNGNAERAFFIFTLAILATAVFLAVRNLRLRRGDRQTALRIAFAGAGLSVAANLMTFEADARLGVRFDDLWNVFGTAMVDGAAMYCVYLALEPFMRRRSPKMLISWTRLLSGRLRDPMVGRDVLIGIVTGLLFATVVVGSNRIISWYAATPNAPHFGVFTPLLGVRYTLANLIASFANGFYEGLLYMTQLAILTMLLRRRLLAAGAFWIAVTALVAIAWGDPAAIPLIAFATGLITLVAVRFGLLSLMLLFTMFAMLMRLPTISGSDWAEPLIAIPFVTAILLALWAFRTALGGVSPFGALEDQS